MSIRKIIEKIVFGHKADSETYIKYLRKIGMRIGEDTYLYAPRRILIDETRPFLIEIGNHVKIGQGVQILTHGYEWSVLKKMYGDVMGSAGKVTIKDNVFIGVNVTILKGVTIGENVIIGANAVINKDIPDNSVVAGNPARVLMSVEEFYKKRLEEQVKEAKEVVREYRKVYKKEVTEDILEDFCFLFNAEEPLPDSWNEKMKLQGNYEESKQKWKTIPKKYSSMQAFLEEIDKEDLEEKNR